MSAPTLIQHFHTNLKKPFVIRAKNKAFKIAKILLGGGQTQDLDNAHLIQTQPHSLFYHSKHSKFHHSKPSQTSALVLGHSQISYVAQLRNLAIESSRVA